jgi:DNA replication protein DnaC
VLLGDSGTGKTHLVIAFGTIAAEQAVAFATSLARN